MLVLVRGGNHGLLATLWRKGSQVLPGSCVWYRWQLRKTVAGEQPLRPLNVAAICGMPAGSSIVSASRQQGASTARGGQWRKAQAPSWRCHWRCGGRCSGSSSKWSHPPAHRCRAVRSSGSCRQPAAVPKPRIRRDAVAALEKASRLVGRAKALTWNHYPSGSDSYAVVLTAATVGNRRLKLPRERRRGCCLQTLATSSNLPACPPARALA